MSTLVLCICFEMPKSHRNTVMSPAGVQSAKMFSGCGITRMCEDLIPLLCSCISSTLLRPRHTCAPSAAPARQTFRSRCTMLRLCKYSSACASSTAIPRIYSGLDELRSRARKKLVTLTEDLLGHGLGLFIHHLPQVRLLQVRNWSCTFMWQFAIAWSHITSMKQTCTS